MIWVLGDFPGILYPALDFMNTFSDRRRARSSLQCQRQLSTVLSL